MNPLDSSGRTVEAEERGSAHHRVKQHAEQAQHMVRWDRRRAGGAPFSCGTTVCPTDWCQDGGYIVVSGNAYFLHGDGWVPTCSSGACSLLEHVSDVEAFQWFQRGRLLTWVR